ncbi:MAG: adenylyl-sulfate kinase [Deltaproteobacteria bacterium]|nr:adenylyl-sulfate kinase [Deltaproteobacteria bacterium]
MTTKASNIVWHNGHVSRDYRRRILSQIGMTLWLTGLPSSGKSTLAFTIEHALIIQGYLAYVLDGDNIRHGLNNNLGFSKEDRSENIRRIAEVAKLFADAGLIVLTSFISPFREDREAARRLHREADLPFVEIHVQAPVEVCEERDPKGLYKKARSGQLKQFTGVDDPYELPDKPEIIIRSDLMRPEQEAGIVLDYLKQNGWLGPLLPA